MRIKQGTIYKVANPEMNAALRACGYQVVPNKKKEKQKYCCRERECRAIM